MMSDLEEKEKKTKGFHDVEYIAVEEGIKDNPAQED
jgi:hypothetical protein